MSLKDESRMSIIIIRAVIKGSKRTRFRNRPKVLSVEVPPESDRVERPFPSSGDLEHAPGLWQGGQ